jgi:hypothetical protein
MKVAIEARAVKRSRPSIYEGLVQALLKAEQQPRDQVVVVTFETADEAKIVMRLRCHLNGWSARLRYFGRDGNNAPPRVRLCSHNRSKTQVELWLERLPPAVEPAEQ